MGGAWIIGPHVVAGALALGFYWRTLLAAKGRPAHRRFGRVYLLLLVPLLASTMPITFAERLDPARAMQLLYLALVVATAGWTAWRGVRDRRAPQRFLGPAFVGLALAMAGAGTALLALGVVRADVLTVGFAVIGVVYGGAMLGQIGRPLAGDWWLAWHLNGVALLFAATHASFVGLLARNLAPGLAGEAMHGLTQLGTIAFAYGFRQWLGRRYGGMARALPSAVAG